MFLEALKIFECDGRICRRQYFVVWAIFTVITQIITKIIVRDASSALTGVWLGLMLGLIMIPTYIKRLHDMNRSGRFVLLSLVPVINIILGFVLLLQSGTKGTNKYGDDPHTKKWF